MQWFRMWAEAVDDEKLRLLAFEDRWHFVALLCLKSKGILDERDTDLRWRKMSIKLGLDSVELETVMKRLETVGLVSCNAEKNFQPVSWNRRQFVSDSSTKRVQTFRKRQRNVSVTPSETDNRVQIQNKRGSGGERACRARRVPPEFSPDLDLARREIPDIDAEREAQRFRDHEFKRARSDWKAVWRTWISNCRDRGQYAKREETKWR